MWEPASINEIRMHGGQECCPREQGRRDPSWSPSPTPLPDSLLVYKSASACFSFILNLCITKTFQIQTSVEMTEKQSQYLHWSPSSASSVIYTPATQVHVPTILPLPEDYWNWCSLNCIWFSPPSCTSGQVFLFCQSLSSVSLGLSKKNHVSREPRAAWREVLGLTNTMRYG